MKGKGLILGLWVVCVIALLSCGGGGRNADAGGHFNPDINYGSFTDPRDNRTYRTVQVGNRTWFAENLNHPADDSWCYDDDNNNCEKYGRLYTWNAAMSVCPEGWRLPSVEDWLDLVSTDGSSEGTKLKSKSGWSRNGNGTDDYGFSALPGGSRRSDGISELAGNFGYWWYAEEDEAIFAQSRGMSFNVIKVSPEYFDGKTYALSVRCVRD